MKTKTTEAANGSESNTNDLLVDALKLYKPPFSFTHGYIFDAEHNTVADDAGVHIARVRGWGRIGSMDNAENLQDAVGDVIAKALTKYWEKHLGN